MTINELPISRTQPGNHDANVPAVGLLQTRHAVLQADKPGLDVILARCVGPHPQPAQIVAAKRIILVLGWLVGRWGGAGTSDGAAGFSRPFGVSAGAFGVSAGAFGIGAGVADGMGVTGGTGVAGISLAFSVGRTGFSSGSIGFSTGFWMAGAGDASNVGFSTGGRTGGVTGFMTDSILAGGGNSGDCGGRTMVGCSFAGALGGASLAGQRPPGHWRRSKPACSFHNNSAHTIRSTPVRTIHSKTSRGKTARTSRNRTAHTSRSHTAHSRS